MTTKPLIGSTPENQAEATTELSADEQNQQPSSGFERFITKVTDWLEVLNQSWSTRNSTPSVMLFAILFLVVTLIIWAANSELDHVVRGQGKVITPQQTQLIQNLEGGIIENVYVREGDIVSEGAVLISLDPTQAKSLYGETKKEERALRIRVERLRAEKDNRALVFSYEMIRDEGPLIEAERALANERKNSQRAELELLQSQINQREEEKRQATAELERAENEYRLASQEYDLIKDLVDRLLEARLSLITAEREKNDAVAKLNNARLEVSRANAIVAEAKHRLEQAKTNFISAVGEELSASLGRLAEVQERLSGLQDRLNRTQLVAPLDAIVNKVHIRTTGGVVQPGEPIVELTPINGRIEVEGAIQQKDVAFLYLEQDVSVKLTAFDFARFGDVPGKITFISPDAQKTEDGKEFFKVRIQLQRNYVESDSANFAITPGMAANVDVIVSKRTVLEYLIEPVLKLRDRAFRE